MNDFELVKKLFFYDPESGDFYRIAKLSWKRNIYQCPLRLIKDVNNFGYYQVNFQGRPHAVHRLIFLYMTGSYPEHDVDHEDGDRLNNSWKNLREATRQENLKNVGIRSDNSSGVTGVSFRKDIGKFTAYIEVNGKRVRLGNFETVVEAREVRKNAEIKYGFHKNHGERLGWQN